jgi:hypothetical protein
VALCSTTEGGDQSLNTENHSETAAWIWSVADLLRGDFKQSQYGQELNPESYAICKADMLDEFPPWNVIFAAQTGLLRLLRRVFQRLSD